MGKLKQFLTLKVRLGRHGFEFHHNPLSRTSMLLNLGAVGSAVLILFTLWGLTLFIPFVVAALVYKEPEKAE